MALPNHLGSHGLVFHCYLLFSLEYLQMCKAFSLVVRAVEFNMKDDKHVFFYSLLFSLSVLSENGHDAACRALPLAYSCVVLRSVTLPIYFLQRQLFSHLWVCCFALGSKYLYVHVLKYISWEHWGENIFTFFSSGIAGHRMCTFYAGR